MFLRNIYEACILKAEEDYNLNPTKLSNQFFNKTDLSDREKGSEDSVIA